MPSFKEQIERAPDFAKEFIERVENEFGRNYIVYTETPDMRIRKITDNTHNEATITWRSRTEHFVIATRLSPGEVRSCGVTTEVTEQVDPLPFKFCVDETIINQESSEILEVLKTAHRYELL